MEDPENKAQELIEMFYKDIQPQTFAPEVARRCALRAAKLVQEHIDSDFYGYWENVIKSIENYKID